MGRGQTHHAAEGCGYPDGARLARARVRVGVGVGVGVRVQVRFRVEVGVRVGVGVRGLGLGLGLGSGIGFGLVPQPVVDDAPGVGEGAVLERRRGGGREGVLEAGLKGNAVTRQHAVPSIVSMAIVSMAIVSMAIVSSPAARHTSVAPRYTY